MNLSIYQVDAFASRVFGGNPAAVVPLDEWLPDELLQSVAAENNLSETAFFIEEGDHYYLRWFTTTIEVDLCGHATLATAHVLFQHLGFEGGEIVFNSKSGLLQVGRSDAGYTMNFPSDPVEKIEPTPQLLRVPGCDVEECFRGRHDLMVVIANEAILRSLNPDLGALADIDARGLLVTAPGDEVDFVSRCFFPRAGIPEDPVTGSAHCTMAPYWADRLGRDVLNAIQVSTREGEVHCRVDGDRVHLTGEAVTYLIGEITVS